jgi:hypothetical protein
MKLVLSKFHLDLLLQPREDISQGILKVVNLYMQNNNTAPVPSSKHIGLVTGACL